MRSIWVIKTEELVGEDFIKRIRTRNRKLDVCLEGIFWNGWIYTRRQIEPATLTEGKHPLAFSSEVQIASEADGITQPYNLLEPLIRAFGEEQQ